MDKPKIRLKQRWLYKNASGGMIVAQVVRHVRPSASYADMRVKQVIGDVRQKRGDNMYDMSLLLSADWYFLPGQHHT
jgi:hypothetical protein